MWFLTCVGAVFNGITLLILGKRVFIIWCSTLRKMDKMYAWNIIVNNPPSMTVKCSSVHDSWYHLVLHSSAVWEEQSKKEFHIYKRMCSCCYCSSFYFLNLICCRPRLMVICCVFSLSLNRNWQSMYNWFIFILYFNTVQNQIKCVAEYKH